MSKPGDEDSKDCNIHGCEGDCGDAVPSAAPVVTEPRYAITQPDVDTIIARVEELDDLGEIGALLTTFGVTSFGNNDKVAILDGLRNWKEVYGGQR